MEQWIQNLPDGWTIYVWLVAAGAIIVGALIGIRWAAKNAQFDEDIKYVIFNKTDKDNMTPEEFARSQEVNKHQEELRDEYLNRQAAERAAKQAAKHAKR